MQYNLIGALEENIRVKSFFIQRINKKADRK